MDKIKKKIITIVGVIIAVIVLFYLYLLVTA